MGENKKKKIRKYKIRHPSARRLPIISGVRGGGKYRGLPPRYPIRYDYGYNKEKTGPKEEKSRWNGKVEIWAQPQLPKRDKIVKYEVDTDKLLKELAKGNKEIITEISEKLSDAKIEKDAEQSIEDKPEETDYSKETEKTSETEPEEEQNDPEEDKPQIEEDPAEDIEQTEALLDMEAESEEIPPEPTETFYANPTFWEQLESKLSSELEIDPQENPELLIEEGEPAYEEGC